MKLPMPYREYPIGLPDYEKETDDHYGFETINQETEPDDRLSQIIENTVNPRGVSSTENNEERKDIGHIVIPDGNLVNRKAIIPPDSEFMADLKKKLISDYSLLGDELSDLFDLNLSISHVNDEIYGFFFENLDTKTFLHYSQIQEMDKIIGYVLIMANPLSLYAATCRDVSSDSKNEGFYDIQARDLLTYEPAKKLFSDINKKTLQFISQEYDLDIIEPRLENLAVLRDEIILNTTFLFSINEPEKRSEDKVLHKFLMNSNPIEGLYEVILPAHIYQRKLQSLQTKNNKLFK